MQQPKISIITVVYNDESGIKRTIDSVASLNYQNTEYIVIDGNSTDNTVDVIRAYSEKICKWISEPDSGIYDAMNKGIGMSTGDWLVFLNAGDEFANKDVISYIIPYINDYDIIYGSMLRVSGAIQYITRGITSEHPDAFDFMHGSLGHQASFINRKVFEKTGYYSTEYKLASDAKFFYDAIVVNSARIKYIDKVIAKFALGGASTTNQQLYDDERKDFLIKSLGLSVYSRYEELYRTKNKVETAEAVSLYKWLKKHYLLYRIIRYLGIHS